MAQQHLAGIAVLVALAFIAMALSACANSEQVAETYGPAIILPDETPGTPEFHGADIGRDTLRGHLQAE
jgi:hypothetical protein